MANSNNNRFYSCNNCWNPVALKEDLLSKAFVVIFENLVLIMFKSKFEKQLITGKFTIADIYCIKCGQVLGWKYFRAHDPKQAYKEGNYIIERAKLFKGN
ncbi:protein yippee-like At4g27740 [Chenopodium quinoa]|uniref:protein yippee-like At4g27740 n=1 Tax=Chenopodium quinoa TaxID=63459 RepID=UPI000B7799EE|nr:protein yippee-like At4g27740 [Chenopodium quinoa]